MSIIVLLLMNLITVLSSYLILLYLIRSEGLVQFFINLFVLYISQIVATELLLGILGVLNLYSVILINLTVLGLVGLVIKAKKLKPVYPAAKEIKEGLSAFHPGRFSIFCLSVLLGFIIVKLAVNLANPPFGWDDLNYHFTFPVEWLKHGNLVNPLVVFDNPCPSYFPVNGSLVYLWFMLPLRNVFIADLGQAPFFVIAFLATYLLARGIELSKTESFIGAFLFSVIPNYFKQLSISYVDIMVASLFLVSLNYVYRLDKKLNIGNVLLFSLSSGLLLGLKTTCLLFIPLLFIPFTYVILKRQNRNKGVVSVFIFLICLLMFGCFGYIRNIIDTGNPMYPLNVNFFGKNILKGVIDNSVFRLNSTQPEDYRLSKILFSQGLGAQTVLLVLPALALGLPFAIIKRRKTHYRAFYLMLLLPLIVFIYRFFIPLPNIRYIYFFFALGMVAAIYLLKRLNTPVLFLRILTIVCLIASLPELARRQELVASLVVTSFLIFILPATLRLLNFRHVRRYLFTGILLIITSLALLQKDYIKNEYPRYVKMVKYSGFWPDATKAWLWMNQNSDRSNIAYAGRPVPFPLYGSQFKNNVYYVSVNRTEPARLHYFKDSFYSWGSDYAGLHKNMEEKDNYRGNQNYDVWLTNLRNLRTDYLFVYSLHQTKDIMFPVEDQWACQNQNEFKPVFSNQTVHIYRLIR